MIVNFFLFILVRVFLYLAIGVLLKKQPLPYSSSQLDTHSVTYRLIDSYGYILPLFTFE